MDLILITQSYPYTQAAEQTFLNQEIPFLANSFDRIFIIPQISNAEKVILSYHNIIIDKGYSKTKSKNTKINAIRNLINYDLMIWKIIIQEILHKPSIFFNIKKALTMLLYLQKSCDFFFWVVTFIKKNKLYISQCVFYTYWFQSTTVGLALLKKKYPDIKIITRTHGTDLFEERHRYNYIPFRRIILKKIDAVFPCMDSGTKYLKSRNNKISIKISTSYLGVDNHGFINRPSEDGVLRIVSCSSIILLKRLNLIGLGIKEMIKLKPEKKIEWIHFGDGEFRKDIDKIINEISSEKVRINLMGQVPLNYILEHYKKLPVDVFINVSSYEGQPVSIKEAISFGIPVIATDVGGNSEIVTKENGILLFANPTPFEIAKAIYWFTENHDKVEEMRTNSRKLFLDKYDSKIVYPDFIHKIKNTTNKK